MERSAPDKEAPANDLFRTSVMVSRDDMRRLKVVQAIEDKDRDELIRELISERVAEIELEAAA